MKREENCYSRKCDLDSPSLDSISKRDALSEDKL